MAYRCGHLCLRSGSPGVAPDDFTEGGAFWEDLAGGVFTVTSGTLTILLSDLSDGLVLADAVRIERLA